MSVKPKTKYGGGGGVHGASRAGVSDHHWGGKGELWGGQSKLCLSI